MMTFERFPLAPQITHFVKDESGIVAADYIFMTASAVATCLSMVSTLTQGTDSLSAGFVNELTNGEIVFMSQNFGRDRATVLMEGNHQFFSANAVMTRYEIWSDPEQKTDEQLRNAHRTWTRRLNDPAYSQPGRAADLVRIFDMAMDARNVEPHDNI